MFRKLLTAYRDILQEQRLLAEERSDWGKLDWVPSVAATITALSAAFGIAYCLHTIILIGDTLYHAIVDPAAQAISWQGWLFVFIAAIAVLAVCGLTPLWAMLLAPACTIRDERIWHKVDRTVKGLFVASLVLMHAMWHCKITPPAVLTPWLIDRNTDDLMGIIADIAVRLAGVALVSLIIPTLVYRWQQHRHTQN